MKYFIILLFVLITASLQAQITTEHVYPNFGRDVSVVTVDSGIEKYIDFNRIDSIYIYNLDHTLDRLIIVPEAFKVKNLQIKYIAKKLFNSDDAYEYLIYDNATSRLRIFTETGETLFTCDTCALHNANNNVQQAANYSASLFNTQQGVKMLVEHFVGTDWYVTVHGLPGKLPGSTIKSGVETPSIISGSGFPTSAYPNPSNGQVRIEYKLPEGVSTGEILLTDISGNEVKRYRVGNVFNDIVIPKSDLASGSYFYKLVTDKGESEARKLVVLR